MVLFYGMCTDLFDPANTFLHSVGLTLVRRLRRLANFKASQVQCATFSRCLCIVGPLAVIISLGLAARTCGV